jgi:hypothetical protein
MEQFLILLSCHFIGDFPFQGDFLALNKGKSWEILLYHCLVYAATFVLFAKVTVAFAVFLVFSHFLIDAMKARYGLIKYIWVDQIFHLNVLFFLVRLGF